MKHLLLFIIKTYWIIIPSKYRKKCIYKISCSNHVFHETKTKGLSNGVKALRERYYNCRQGFELFKNPIDGSTQMILPQGGLLNEDEIAERLL